MPKIDMARSIDPRTRPIPMRLKIEVELFYAAQGEFVRDCSTTRAMEQFLIERANVQENINAIASSVKLRAALLGKPPKEVVKDFLRSKYDFLDAEPAAEALCLSWGLDP